MQEEWIRYYFACDFLWCVLALATEEVLNPETNVRFRQGWMIFHTKLADWALQERFDLFNHKKIPMKHQQELLSLADTASEVLMSRWLEKLHVAARNFCIQFPSLSEPKWLYYCYCRFLKQVLVQFEHILQGLDMSSPYYGLYKESAAIVKDLSGSLEREQPAHEPELSIEDTALIKLKVDMDIFATQLSADWGEAVILAAHDAKQ